jgi:DNA polymerase-4
MKRWIVHLDMDSFFVSVERLLDPSLHGRPVVVGGDPEGRGVVASASYEARRYGVHSAMPSRRARQLCPELVFLRGHHGLYGEYHEKVRAILGRSVPVIEAASVDEFYLDLSGCILLHGPILPLLRRIRRQIGSELGLPASAGLGGNKLVAKIASGLAKPSGVLWVPQGEEAPFLAPLPVRKLPGVGPATEDELRKLGIRRIGHLASFPERVLESALGTWGSALSRKSRGLSDSPVAEGGTRKSVGHETTFREDTADTAFLEAVLCRLVEKAAWRLRAKGLRAGGVTLKVRYADFRTITRSRSIIPTDRDGELLRALRELFAATFSRRVRIRLLGVSLDRLVDGGEQLDLFAAEEGRRRSLLFPAVDRLREKFGFEALSLGAGLSSPPRS